MSDTSQEEPQFCIRVVRPDGSSEYALRLSGPLELWRGSKQEAELYAAERLRLHGPRRFRYVVEPLPPRFHHAADGEKTASEV